MQVYYSPGFDFCGVEAREGRKVREDMTALSLTITGRDVYQWAEISPLHCYKVDLS